MDRRKSSIPLPSNYKSAENHQLLLKIGDLFRFVRERQDISRYELCKYLSISEKSIQRVENGNLTKLDILLILSSGLGFNYHYLFHSLSTTQALLEISKLLLKAQYHLLTLNDELMITKSIVANLEQILVSFLRNYPFADSSMREHFNKLNDIVDNPTLLEVAYKFESKLLLPLFRSIEDQIFSCGILLKENSIDLPSILETISQNVGNNRHDSQNACSEKANTSVWTLRRLENCHSQNIKVETLLNIADAINVSINDLLPQKLDTIQQVIQDIYSIVILQEFYLL